MPIMGTRGALSAQGFGQILAAPHYTGNLVAINNIASTDALYPGCIGPDGSSLYSVDEPGNRIVCSQLSQGTQAAATYAAADNTPVAAAISTDGLFVYVSNYGSSFIRVYSRNTSTGALTLGASYTSPANCFGIFLTTDNKNVYIASESANTVTAYSRNTSTGALALINAYSVGSTPYSVTASPDGLFIYVTNDAANSITCFSRNTGTGALTLVGTTALTASANTISTAISPDGLFTYSTYYSLAQIQICSRNASTGVLTVGSTVSVANNPETIGITIDGRFLYVGCTGTGNVVQAYSRNISTGALTLLNSYSLTGANGIIISPDQKYVYSASNTTGGVQSYRRI